MPPSRTGCTRTTQALGPNQGAVTWASLRRACRAAKEVRTVSVGRGAGLVLEGGAVKDGVGIVGWGSRGLVVVDVATAETGEVVEGTVGGFVGR